MEMFQRQYRDITVIEKNIFHDRFIIVDKKELYHIGSSINHAGNGVFLARKENDEWILDSLLKLL